MSSPSRKRSRRQRSHRQKLHLSRKRRAWTLEKLEERHMLSADSGMQVVSLDDFVDRAFAQAADLSQYSQEQLALAEQWVVRTTAGITEGHLEAISGLDVTPFPSGNGNVFLLDTSSMSADQIVGSLAGLSQVEHFYPDVPREYAKKSTIPNDPLFEDQWYLQNIGQLISRPHVLNAYATPGEDIRALKAWETATGEGVVIAIIDDGVLFSHPDLGAYGTPNWDPTKAATNLGWDFVNSQVLALPLLGSDFHGTAVAGIIGATGNNGTGVTGVAYDSTLVSLRLLSPPSVGSKNTDANQALAFFWRPNDIDIYNSGWGTPDDTRALAGPGPLAAQALMDAAFKGRLSADGLRALGNIHIFAAGNGAAISDNSNFDGYANSIYTIAVGAVGHNGAAASYSETGSNIHIVAPSASGPSGITTTDLFGEHGYNKTGINNDQTLILNGGSIETFQRDYLANIDYTSRFGTTSASAAMVSGVVALMLEAAADNGIELSLRDVQTILAKSARKNDPFEGGWLASGQSYFRNPISEVVDAQGNRRPLEPRDTSAWVNNGDLVLFPGQGEGPGESLGVTPWPDVRPDWLNLPFSADGLQDEFFLNAPPPRWVNGAGYTVHYTSSSSYGHGVVDAALAVELAANWNHWLSRGTHVEQAVGSAGGMLNPVAGNVPSAEATIAGLVPGGVGGSSGFAGFFNEFFNLDPPGPPPDGPFNDPENLPPNTRGSVISFNLPRNLEIETIELSVDIDVDPDQVDKLRIALMSPDGTVTEFNNYVGPNGSLESFMPDGSSNLSWTFSTTRHMGEKGTKEIVDLNPGSFTYGLAIDKPWRLIIENYSLDAEATVNSWSVNAYGKEVAPGRIQGFVGMDIDGDGVVTFPDDPFYDPVVVTDQVLAGATVWLDVNNNGMRDASEPWQITGADGNYYFDIPYNTANRPSWQVGIEIPEGYRDLTEDPLNPNQTGVMLSGPIIVGTNANPAIPDDQQTGISFQLDPLSATLSGTAFADVNGDGNSTGDPRLGGRTIYIDLNENGVFDDPDDPFEPTPDLISTVTNSDGTWQLTANLVPGYYTVAIAPENGVVPSSPEGGFYRIYIGPGDTITNLDFGTNPGAGLVSGFVYFDVDGNGVQDPGDAPIGGFDVYVDLNNDGKLGLAEPMVTTTADGGFTFADLPFNQYAIRILPEPGWRVTSPALPQDGTFFDQAFQIEISPGSAITGLAFGVTQHESHDYGDLPDSYRTSLAANGARHGLFPGFSLGKLIDGENDGFPSADAQGDNMEAMQDEDGILNASSIVIEPGESFIINVEVSSASKGLLFLQGWIDFNDDGDFNDPGEHLQFRDPTTGAPITTGHGNGRQIWLESDVTSLMVIAPANVAATELAARFRYSERQWDNVSQFNKPNGAAVFGEVEDYYLSAQPAAATAPTPVAGDFDGSGMVDQGDYTLWKQNFGSTIDLRADANGDNVVDMADYTVWRNNLGATAPAAVMAPVMIQESIPDPNVGVANDPALEAMLASVGAVKHTTVVNGETVTYYTLPEATPAADLGGFFLVTEVDQSSDVAAPVTADSVPAPTPTVDLAFDLVASEDDEDEDSLESLLEDDVQEQADLALALAFEEEYL